MKSPIARGDIKASFRSERPNPGSSIAPKCVVSASRDQVGKYALGPRTEQQSVRVSRIAFHETNGHAVDDAKGRLAFDLTQTLVLLALCHVLLSSAYGVDYGRTTKMNLLDDGIDHVCCRANTSTRPRETKRHP